MDGDQLKRGKDDVLGGSSYRRQDDRNWRLDTVYCVWIMVSTLLPTKYKEMMMKTMGRFGIILLLVVAQNVVAGNKTVGPSIYAGTTLHDVEFTQTNPGPFPVLANIVFHGKACTEAFDVSWVTTTKFVNRAKIAPSKRNTCGIPNPEKWVFASADGHENLLISCLDVGPAPLESCQRAVLPKGASFSLIAPQTSR